VVLTDAGRTTLQEASAAGAEAERLFLGPLSGYEAAQLRQALRAIAFPAPAEPVSHRR
jgi:DNA-binding MarR family transcriptional regulator